MNYILDTHTFIWFVNGNKNLSSGAKRIIESERVKNYISIASLWEIAIKVSLNKLELKTPFAEVLGQIEKNNFDILPICFEDTLIVSSLPFHHRDPFDRVIAAQCLNNNFELISIDTIFSKYKVKRIW